MSTNLSIKGFITLLLLTSLAGNVFLYRSYKEAKTVEETPVRAESTYVREIAQLLGVSTIADKTDGDLVTDIKIALDNAVIAPKNNLSEKSFIRICKTSFPEEETILREMYKLLEQVKGQRLLIITPEDN